ncbi:MAG: Hsp70 family protein, partial [Brevundimonas sp.]
IVNVSAKDKATNKEQSIRIQANGGLSDADIEKMVKEAEANAAADKAKKDLVEAQNAADSLIHSTEKALAEHGDKVSGDEKAAIETALTDLKAARDGSDHEDIRAKTATLVQASMKLGEAMYKAQTDQDGAAAPASDDGVVDAEFEDVSDEDQKKSA